MSDSQDFYFHLLNFNTISESFEVMLYIVQGYSHHKKINSRFRKSGRYTIGEFGKKIKGRSQTKLKTLFI